MAKIKLLKSTLLALSLSLLGTSYAEAAETFTGASTGVFGEPGTLGGSVFSGVGTNVFTSGTPFGGSNPNVLTFSGNRFSAVADTPFTIGTLDYANGVTTSGSEVTSVPLNTTLTFTDPLSISQSFEFQLDFNITPNDGPDRFADADRLIAMTSVPDQTFEFDGTSFTLELLGFEQAGAINNEFFAFEDTTTSGLLIGQITEAVAAPPSQDVPEPFSVLGLGAFAIAAAATRKRSKLVA